MSEPTGASGSSRRRGWIGAVSALVLTFVAGLALGWSLGHRELGDRGGPPGRQAGRDRGREAFERRVGITPAQRVVIDSISGARRTQIDAFWRGPGQALRAILDSTQSDVRAVLTPEQRVRFDAHRREEDARRAARRGRGGAFPGPGGGGFPGQP